MSQSVSTLGVVVPRYEEGCPAVRGSVRVLAVS